MMCFSLLFFFFQAEDGIRDDLVTGVQTCALPICNKHAFLLVLLVFTFSCKSQLLYQVYPDTILKWNYFFGDEFETEKIDESKWWLSFPWGRPLWNQDVIYIDKNSRSSDGNAVFTLD